MNATSTAPAPATKPGGKLAADGMTMLVVTHEMGFAREAADRVIFIDGGRIVEDSEPEEFFAHPKNKRLQDFLSKML